MLNCVVCSLSLYPTAVNLLLYHVTYFHWLCHFLCRLNLTHQDVLCSDVIHKVTGCHRLEINWFLYHWMFCKVQHVSQRAFSSDLALCHSHQLIVILLCSHYINLFRTEFSSLVCLSLLFVSIRVQWDYMLGQLKQLLGSLRFDEYCERLVIYKLTLLFNAVTVKYSWFLLWILKFLFFSPPWKYGDCLIVEWRYILTMPRVCWTPNI